jgi:NTE family protein
MSTSPSSASPYRKTGLVLVGGGARGAYQAGVLRGLAEILGKRFGARPLFEVVTGISAGAINAAFVASHADRMLEGIQGLHALWHDIHVNQVMRTDVYSLTSIGARWMRDLSLGGMLSSRKVRSNHLLDTTPLHGFLRQNIDFARIGTNVESGAIHGFGISATNYNTGTAVTFYDSHAEIGAWTRSARLGVRTRIGLEHVLASASIPILFKPVPVEGAFYGDGGIRMSTPLSPAIHLGSDRVLAISIRHPRSSATTLKINLKDGQQNEISVADIAGVMLNAAFLDGLESDAERMIRINQTIALIDEEKRLAGGYGLRPIPLYVASPSVDLATLASDQFKRFPRTLRYALKGIGASDERGADLISYLAFDPSFTRPLLEIGYADALAQKDALEMFFLD